MSVAKAYAKALYQVALENKTPTEVEALCNSVQTQLEWLNASIGSSKALQVALLSPVTNAKEKASLVRELAQKAGAVPLVSNFVVLLANKGRLPLLEQVLNEFNATRLLDAGGLPGYLSSAEAMSDVDVDGLAKAFSKRLGKKVAFRVSTDPSLLAGMKVTVSGVTYDGTLRSQLQRLRDKFLAAASSE